MTKDKRSLQTVVDEETYAVWPNMLQRLVPGGRTHRIALMVAGMLQYATLVAREQVEGDLGANSVVQSLLSASEMYNVNEVRSEIGDVTAQLFKDAGVSFVRANARGEQYSIAEAAWSEFLRWYDMPWE